MKESVHRQTLAGSDGKQIIRDVITQARRALDLLQTTPTHTRNDLDEPTEHVGRRCHTPTSSIAAVGALAADGVANWIQIARLTVAEYL